MLTLAMACVAGFAGGVVATLVTIVVAVLVSVWRRNHVHKPAVLQYVRNHSGRIAGHDLYRYVEHDRDLITDLVMGGLLAVDKDAPDEFYLTPAGLLIAG